MGRDESGTLACLQDHRKQRFEPILARYGGRLVKLTGDGALAEFRSAVDALGAAIEFQQAMADANRDRPADSAITFRLGLHLGDLIVDGDDLYGDGVNIAARLEAEAPAGGIVVSRAIREAVDGRLKAKLNALGELSLKNIERPIRAFLVEWDEADWKMAPGEVAQPAQPVGSALPTLALPDRPSIAVLPFENMSGDPEQDYFADGMVEDIITALSRFKSLFVIARNSSFTYKGRAVDIKQVGRDLGVRYVLEGSVRKAAGRVRITSQLIETATGGHLWADRFDGSLEDIFDLQDKVTANVIGQIAPRVEQAEIERAKSKPTGSLDAYDHFLRGMASYYRSTRQSLDDALGHYYKALELDPGFAAAYGWAALSYTLRKQARWMADPQREALEGVRLARRAIDLGKDDAFALSAGGFTLAFLAGELDAAVAFTERAQRLNSNLVSVWHGSAWIRCYVGDASTAIEHIAHAMRLSPLDPQMGQFCLATALAKFLAGQYAEAASWAEKVTQEQPDFLPGLISFARCSACAGRLDEARVAMAWALQIDPTLSLSTFTNSIFRRPEDRAKLREGLRLAGMPE